MCVHTRRVLIHSDFEISDCYGCSLKFLGPFSPDSVPRNCLWNKSRTTALQRGMYRLREPAFLHRSLIQMQPRWLNTSSLCVFLVVEVSRLMMSFTANSCEAKHQCCYVELSGEKGRNTLPTCLTISVKHSRCRTKREGDGWRQTNRTNETKCA